MVERAPTPSAGDLVVAPSPQQAARRRDTVALRRAQGLPDHIEDPDVLDRVIRILRAGDRRPKRAAPTTAGTAPARALPAPAPDSRGAGSAGHPSEAA